MSESHDQELSDLARTLAALRPSSAGLERDPLMYEAGRASARPRYRWLWPASTGVLTAVVACLVLALVFRPEPAPVVHFVERPAPPPAMVEVDVPLAPAIAEAPTSPSYWQLQEEMLRHGLDELPLVPPGPPAADGSVPSIPLAVWDWRTRSALVSSLIELE
jgi:hypothetical protein